GFKFDSSIGGPTTSSAAVQGARFSLRAVNKSGQIKTGNSSLYCDFLSDENGKFEANGITDTNGDGNVDSNDLPTNCFGHVGSGSDYYDGSAEYATVNYNSDDVATSITFKNVGAGTNRPVEEVVPGDYILSEVTPPVGYKYTARTWFVHLEEGNTWYTVYTSLISDYYDVASKAKENCPNYTIKPNCVQYSNWHWLPTTSTPIGATGDSYLQVNTPNFLLNVPNVPAYEISLDKVDAANATNLTSLGQAKIASASDWNSANTNYAEVNACSLPGANQETCATVADLANDTSKKWYYVRSHNNTTVANKLVDSPFSSVKDAVYTVRKVVLGVNQEFNTSLISSGTNDAFDSKGYVSSGGFYRYSSSAYKLSPDGFTSELDPIVYVIDEQVAPQGYDNPGIYYVVYWNAVNKIPVVAPYSDNGTANNYTDDYQLTIDQANNILGPIASLGGYGSSATSPTTTLAHLPVTCNYDDNDDSLPECEQDQEDWPVASYVVSDLYQQFVVALRKVDLMNQDIGLNDVKFSLTAVDSTTGTPYSNTSDLFAECQGQTKKDRDSEGYLLFEGSPDNSACQNRDGVNQYLSAGDYLLQEVDNPNPGYWDSKTQWYLHLTPGNCGTAGTCNSWIAKYKGAGVGASGYGVADKSFDSLATNVDGTGPAVPSLGKIAWYFGTYDNPQVITNTRPFRLQLTKFNQNTNQPVVDQTSWQDNQAELFDRAMFTIQESEDYGVTWKYINSINDGTADDPNYDLSDSAAEGASKFQMNSNSVITFVEDGREMLFNPSYMYKIQEVEYPGDYVVANEYFVLSFGVSEAQLEQCSVNPPAADVCVNAISTSKIVGHEPTTNGDGSQDSDWSEYSFNVYNQPILYNLDISKFDIWNNAKTAVNGVTFDLQKYEANEKDLSIVQDGTAKGNLGQAGLVDDLTKPLAGNTMSTACLGSTTSPSNINNLIVDSSYFKSIKTGSGANNSGEAKFGGLQPGCYLLTESEVPTGYVNGTDVQDQYQHSWLFILDNQDGLPEVTTIAEDGSASISSALTVSLNGSATSSQTWDTSFEVNNTRAFTFDLTKADYSKTDKLIPEAGEAAVYNASAWNQILTTKGTELIASGKQADSESEAKTAVMDTTAGTDLGLGMPSTDLSAVFSICELHQAGGNPIPNSATDSQRTINLSALNSTSGTNKCVDTSSLPSTLTDTSDRSSEQAWDSYKSALFDGANAYILKEVYTPANYQAFSLNEFWLLTFEPSNSKPVLTRYVPVDSYSALPAATISGSNWGKALDNTINGNPGLTIATETKPANGSFLIPNDLTRYELDLTKINVLTKKPLANIDFILKAADPATGETYSTADSHNYLSCQTKSTAAGQVLFTGSRNNTSSNSCLDSSNNAKELTAGYYILNEPKVQGINDSGRSWVIYIDKNNVNNSWFALQRFSDGTGSGTTPLEINSANYPSSQTTKFVNSFKQCSANTSSCNGQTGLDGIGGTYNDSVNIYQLNNSKNPLANSEDFKINWEKVDAETFTSLNLVVFKLEESQDLGSTWITISDNYSDNSAELLNSNYWYKMTETAALGGYKLADTFFLINHTGTSGANVGLIKTEICPSTATAANSWAGCAALAKSTNQNANNSNGWFVVTDNASVLGDEEVTVHATNKFRTQQLLLRKTDLLTGKVMENVQFTLTRTNIDPDTDKYGAAYTAITCSAKTNSLGEIAFGEWANCKGQDGKAIRLVAGNYILHEITPAGYFTASDLFVHLQNNAGSWYAENRTWKGSLDSTYSQDSRTMLSGSLQETSTTVLTKTGIVNIENEPGFVVECDPSRDNCNPTPITPTPETDGQDCSNADYFAAHKSECDSDNPNPGPTPEECQDPDYATAHPDECGSNPNPNPDTNPECALVDYAGTHGDECAEPPAYPPTGDPTHDPDPKTYCDEKQIASSECQPDPNDSNFDTRNWGLRKTDSSDSKTIGQIYAVNAANWAAHLAKADGDVDKAAAAMNAYTNMALFTMCDLGKSVNWNGDINSDCNDTVTADNMAHNFGSFEYSQIRVYKLTEVRSPLGYQEPSGQSYILKFDKSGNPEIIRYSAIGVNLGNVNTCSVTAKTNKCVDQNGMPIVKADIANTPNTFDFGFYKVDRLQYNALGGDVNAEDTVGGAEFTLFPTKVSNNCYNSTVANNGSTKAVNNCVPTMPNGYTGSLKGIQGGYSVRSSADGVIAFKDVPAGWYLFQETQAPFPFVQNTTVYLIHFTPKVVDCSVENSATGEKENTTCLPIYKVDTVFNVKTNSDGSTKKVFSQAYTTTSDFSLQFVLTPENMNDSNPENFLSLPESSDSTVEPDVSHTSIISEADNNAEDDETSPSVSPVPNCTDGPHSTQGNCQLNVKDPTNKKESSVRNIIEVKDGWGNAAFPNDRRYILNMVALDLGDCSRMKWQSLDSQIQYSLSVYTGKDAQGVDYAKSRDWTKSDSIQTEKNTNGWLTGVNTYNYGEYDNYLTPEATQAANALNTELFNGPNLERDKVYKLENVKTPNGYESVQQIGSFYIIYFKNMTDKTPTVEYYQNANSVPVSVVDPTLGAGIGNIPTTIDFETQPNFGCQDFYKNYAWDNLNWMNQKVQNLNSSQVKKSSNINSSTNRIKLASTVADSGMNYSLFGRLVIVESYKKAAPTPIVCPEGEYLVDSQCVKDKDIPVNPDVTPDQPPIPNWVLAVTGASILILLLLLGLALYLRYLRSRRFGSRKHL
ncbi:MAG: prealbumin-like fold domain-containing protein, partial [Candidatus Ancillula sp.]|nr:prealbumin-like fold domain-containing protein [Candidatus Ancillula sp.]